MTAQKKIIVLLVSILITGSLYAQKNHKQEIQANEKPQSKTFLELLNLEQFRGISYKAFIEKYPKFWIFAMDFDDNKLPRRYMKAPIEWSVEINGLVFDNLIIIFLNNQVHKIILSTEEKGKTDFSINDFLEETAKSHMTELITDNDRKIVIKLNDRFNIVLECRFPSDYHDTDVSLLIWMR